jgi:hypothetical protein
MQKSLKGQAPSDIYAELSSLSLWIASMGLLKWCLEYAKSPKTPPLGIFSAVKANFMSAAKTELLDLVDKIYSFRNEYIAH